MLWLDSRYVGSVDKNRAIEATCPSLRPARPPIIGSLRGAPRVSVVRRKSSSVPTFPRDHERAASLKSMRLSVSF